GSGKSSVIQELKQRGQAAFDADETCCLGVWYAADGREVESMASCPDYHKTAQYLWDGKIVKELLRQVATDPTIRCTYLAGISGNAVDHASLFDKVVYLDEDAHTLYDRINGREGVLFPWRLPPADVGPLTQTVERFRGEMNAIGALAVGPGLTVPQAANAIMSYTGHPSPLNVPGVAHTI
ncbi:MAG TPA: hypothetical protein VD735_05990, partial [Candidatus Saccharimonadales bacterium]|nr:hypothetical protein [Candidatus Saccharimonadales bacterium]